MSLQMVLYEIQSRYKAWESMGIPPYKLGALIFNFVLSLDDLILPADQHLKEFRGLTTFFFTDIRHTKFHALGMSLTPLLETSHSHA